MTHNRHIARRHGPNTPIRRAKGRRGAASGWIILIVILAILAALVSWRMIHNRQANELAPTTAPDAP